MQSVTLRCTSSAYVVRIGSNLLSDLGREAKAAARSRKTVVITDSNVAGYYLEPALAGLRDAGLKADALIVPPGESSKTLAQAGELFDGLLRAGADRGSVVIGLGGGVVTDLAGFVAATYMRGVPWIAFSTSLLGQVDASVGGKTAVDHPRCKNLIGAFHQPAAVLCDVSALATLPDEELRTGLAECVKHAVIRDPSLFDVLEQQAHRILGRDAGVLEDVVARNVRIKAEVVMADEHEGGLRRILNYGHTIGHAIETLAQHSGGLLGRDVVTHGRAVALGMMAEARLARRRGLADDAFLGRQRDLLSRLGLPVNLCEPLPVDQCLRLMHHDKKAEAGRMRFVLPRTIGQTVEVDDVTDEETREALCWLAGN